MQPDFDFLLFAVKNMFSIDRKNVRREYTITKVRDVNRRRL